MYSQFMMQGQKTSSYLHTELCLLSFCYYCTVWRKNVLVWICFVYISLNPPSVLI